MFSVYGAVEEKDNDVFEVVDGLNNIPFKNIDLSNFTAKDVVGLIDGDWLAYSVCCTLDEHDEIYVAKGRINAKINSFLKESKCNKLIVFCGSTGNYRLDLLLPKRINTVADNSGRYKDNRKDNEAPPFLEEIKSWMMQKYMSWWAVGMEADDCIVMSSFYLTNNGIISFIYGIDKDYNQIHGGGLAIVGHHDKPTWYNNDEQNRLGELVIKQRTVTRANGTSYIVKDVKGHGDKYLVFQCLTEDVVDNYSCKNFIKNNFNGGNFSDTVAVNYINQAKSLKHLWQLYIDYLRNKLPYEFEYEAWNGEIVQSSPMDIANLYFQCACMIRTEGLIPSLTDYMEYVE